MRRRFGAVLLVFGSTTAFADQSCDSSHYALSAPTARFTDNGDGTVTDTHTHMMWMRCSLGQTWTGSTCQGAPAEMPWQAAQDEAVSMNKQGGFARHDDWRMPRIPELANIVEVQCANPRTNIAVFPHTPAAFYWTASSRRNKDQAFMLSFGPQGTGDDVKTQPHYVRLVRGS